MKNNMLLQLLELRNVTQIRSIPRIRSGFRRKALSSAMVALAAVVSAANVNAQLMQNLSMGNPKALALGHAVTADPPGIDSIHFNPAGLAKIRGRQQQTKILAAHMSFMSKTGEQQNTQAVRDAFDTFNDAALAQDPDAVLVDFPDDDQAGISATATQPLVMLPFAGMTEVPVILAPFGGIAIEDPHHGWTFGTAVYTPLGMGFARDRDDDPGSYQGYETALTRLTYFSPTIGVQVTDTLAIGVGINFSWQGFATTTKFRAPDQTIIFLNRSENALGFLLSEAEDAEGAEGAIDTGILGAFDNIGDLEIEATDPLSLGFNFGLLWEPTPWISFGFVYQSETKADMEGDFKMTYEDAFLGTTIGLKPLSPAFSLIGGAEFNAQRVEEGKITVEMIQPQHIALGTSIQLLPNIKVNVDMKWTEFSKWEDLTISFDQNVDFLNLASIVNFIAGTDNADPNELRIPRGYEDVLSWAFGVEYQANDSLVFRMGYEPRGSAVPDDKVDFLFPIADADLYSFGFGYQIDSESRMDFAVAYLVSTFEADLRVTVDENGKETATGVSSNANSITPGDVVYNPYAYLPIEGKTEAYLFTISYDEKF